MSKKKAKPPKPPKPPKPHIPTLAELLDRFAPEKWPKKEKPKDEGGA